MTWLKVDSIHTMEKAMDTATDNRIQFQTQGTVLEFSNTYKSLLEKIGKYIGSLQKTHLTYNLYNHHFDQQF